MTDIDRWNALRDALKLAEQATAYIDGEQWAVTAVLLLRSEAVKASKAMMRQPDSDELKWAQDRAGELDLP